MNNRKIRMGMVGGGRGAFIGAVHRMAAAIDGEIELVCGAFSSNPKKSKLSGQDLYLPADRVYGSYEEMIKKEKELPLGERMEQKQAAWRTDPKRSGIAGAMGDIGTHAENLAEYISGLQIKKICADLSALVPGRALDDDGNVLLEFDNGAKGILYASQISAGEENNLHINIYGTKAGLEWHQMEPNSLVVKWLDKPMEILRTGVGDMRIITFYV